MNTHPSRIVCLSAETTETLCLLGEGDRIVGFSAPACRLPVAQHRKPRVSIYTGTRIERICALEPDLVLGSGAAHGAVLGALAQRGIAVHLFNQRSVRGILDMIRVVGGMVGCAERAADLAARLEWRIEAVRVRSPGEHKPRVYLEEWAEPAISASAWVSELIGIAGGINCFSDLAEGARQEDRIVESFDEVVRRAPDIVISASNARTFQRERIARRPGWRHLPAVVNGELHRIDPLSLQAGPAALSEGLDQLARIIDNWRERRSRMFHTALMPSVAMHSAPSEAVNGRVA